MLKQNVPSEECSSEIYCVNLQRTYGLALMLFVADFGLLSMDYLNLTQGLWRDYPSYKTLFYSHVALGVGMLITLIVFWVGRPLSPAKSEKVQQTITYVFIFYILTMAALISGWIDQSIHGQITVYMLGCFVVAILYYMEPLPGLVLYLFSYIVFMIGATLTQHHREVLQGHYINATLLVVISYGLTRVLYKMKTRDILHKNHLAELVSQRTAKLQETNKELQREIEEREHAVDAQRQTHDKLLRLASIVESSNDAIMGITLEGTVNDWNPGAAKMFGFSEEQIVGKSIFEIATPDRQDEVRKILEEIAAGQPAVHHQILGQVRLGAQLDVSLTASPIHNSTGAIVGISMIFRDITAQNELQREMSHLQQLNLVGEMAASISHEVRNPVTTVRGFLQLLNEKQDLRAYQDYFTLMIEELDRANSIISEFLTISRTKVSELKETRLDEMVRKILPLLEAGALQFEMRLSTQLNPTAKVRLNESEIRQVIFNLARNGCQAMKPGGLLTIETATTEDGVALIVRDQGPGISSDVLAKLGTPFFSTKDKGTGLGLAVCYGIVERHNGKICVKSSPEGTTFAVRLPAK